MKKQWLVFCLAVVSVSMIYAAGKADDLVRLAGKKLSKETLKLGAKKADDAIRYASRHADDWGKIVVNKFDDSARLFSRKSDDFARLGLRHGDDVIYDFSKVHSRIARTAKTKPNKVPKKVSPRFSKIKITGKVDDVLRVSDIADDAVSKVVPIRVSKTEFDFYTKIKLQSKVVNGRPALTRTDIDPSFVPNVVIGGKKNTMTNLELMRNGKAPFIKTATGTEQVTLHHVRQQSDGVLAEILPQSEEKASGLYNVLHDSNLPSQINRSSFYSERKTYWATRANDFEGGL